MSGKIRLDQAFYASDAAGYGIKATSFADNADAREVIDACLAIGQAPGEGIARPILLTRILGGRIIFARICSGGKDFSGRNTIFIHALAGEVELARRCGITAFVLADSGLFRETLDSGKSIEPVMAEGCPPDAAPDRPALELPAVIETAVPADDVLRRVLAGCENTISWSSFGFAEMPGYDLICLPPYAERPACRAVYDCGMNLVRKAVSGVPSPAPCVTDRASSRTSVSGDPPGVRRERRNVLFVPFLVSLAINAMLLFVVFSGGGSADGSLPSAEPPAEKANREFAGERRVSDEDLANAGYPLDELISGANEKWSDATRLVRKLLAYRDFVEKNILNVK